VGQNRTILIVDDDSAVIASLSLLLRRSGHMVRTASSPPEAMKQLEFDANVDLILQDMNYSRKTSGEEGMRLLSQIKTGYPAIPVVLMTAWGSVPLAVKGIKAGAADFITKPWSNEQILNTVGTILGLFHARGRDVDKAPTRSELDLRYDFSSIVGQDPQLLKVLDTVGRVATTNAPVLITGESGTGKELIAEALWRNGPRKKKSFAKVNLGGIPTSLFESEMFGHVAGAFTDAKTSRMGRFETAHGGTLFLDEIGDLAPSNQVKLLRALQDRTFERLGSSRSITVDFHLVCATLHNLPERIEEGLFREDLFYRINLITLHLPPLRKRPGDIPLLVQSFLDQISKQYHREGLEWTQGALDWLSSQSWPGNIRELRQLVERTVLLMSGDRITAEDLTVAHQMQPSAPSTYKLPEPGSMTLEELEMQMIRQTLEQYGGKVAEAAKALGISRSSLYRKIEKFEDLP
jgi:DNA-binding NtrC family response regulator